MQSSADEEIFEMSETEGSASNSDFECYYGVEESSDDEWNPDNVGDIDDDDYGAYEEETEPKWHIRSKGKLLHSFHCPPDQSSSVKFILDSFRNIRRDMKERTKAFDTMFSNPNAAKLNELATSDDKLERRLAKLVLEIQETVPGIYAITKQVLIAFLEQMEIPVTSAFIGGLKQLLPSTWEEFVVTEPIKELLATDPLEYMVYEQYISPTCIICQINEPNVKIAPKCSGICDTKDFCKNIQFCMECMLKHYWATARVHWKKSAHCPYCNHAEFCLKDLLKIKPIIIKNQ
jgi:hypothetical protein